jgi:hypothetical protein
MFEEKSRFFVNTTDILNLQLFSYRERRTGLFFCLSREITKEVEIREINHCQRMFREFSKNQL